MVTLLKNGMAMTNNQADYANLLQLAKQVDVKLLGRVAVLMGGIAAEREVSLKSGQSVYDALLAKQVNVDLIDVTTIQQLTALAGKYDGVFNAIHGRWGEDGGVQAILDSLNIPYTGSGQAASSLAMDKLRTKWLWKGVGISTPDFRYVSPQNPFSVDSFNMVFPVIVKPVREGSSLGMKKANNLQELSEAVKFAEKYDSEILIEQWITGREFTCAIVDDVALPLIELKTEHDFYDFDAKYKTNDTQYLSPVSLNEAVISQIKSLSLQGFDVLGASGWGRMDIMLDEKNTPWLIELNTVPGMTNHSLVPMAAKQVGLSFSELVVLLLSLVPNKK